MTTEKRTPLGRDLEEAFHELAAHLHGKIEAENYAVNEVPKRAPGRMKRIRPAGPTRPKTAASKNIKIAASKRTLAKRRVRRRKTSISSRPRKRSLSG